MKLHEQVKHFKGKADALEIALDSVLSYVCSPKYSTDNLCNTNDIVLRIREAQRDIDINFTDKE